MVASPTSHLPKATEEGKDGNDGKDGKEGKEGKEGKDAKERLSQILRAEIPEADLVKPWIVIPPYHSDRPRQCLFGCVSLVL